MIHSVSEQLKKMDLGCLDLGCVEKQISQSSVDSDINLDDSTPSSSKPPKVYIFLQFALSILFLDFLH